MDVGWSAPTVPQHHDMCTSKSAELQKIRFHSSVTQFLCEADGVLSLLISLIDTEDSLTDEWQKCEHKERQELAARGSHQG